MLHCVPALFSLALPAPAAPQFPNPPVPDGNPITVQKLLLGKALFWDEQLSSTRTVACGTCHFPEYGGSDRRSTHFPEESTHPGLDGIFGTEDDVIGSAGVIRNLEGGHYEPAALFGLDPQVTPRKAPSFINAGFSPSLFWDGRAEGTFRDPETGQVILQELAALESQVTFPLVSESEMGHAGIEWDDVVDRVQGARPLELATEIPPALAEFIEGRTYADLFSIVFDSPVVTPARIAMAIATYERELVSDQARIDDFPNGFNEEELLGGFVFDTSGRCGLCHQGAIFSDHSFRNIGVRPIEEDRGRGAVTGLPEDDGKFRVPSLRNADLRTPLFHNGGMNSLEEVVEFYDRGGDFHENQDPDIMPLNLTAEEKAALVAYLRTFTDERVHFRQPPFDRPTLYTETPRVPAAFGSGSPGAAGFVPRAIAIDPPSLTNPRMTLGVDGALGGAPAFLLVSTTADPSGTEFRGVTLHVGLPEPGALLLDGRGPGKLGLGPGTYVIDAGRLGGAGAGEGYGSLVFDLTGASELHLGTTLFVQWLIVDPDSPGGSFSASPAVELTLF